MKLQDSCFVGQARMDANTIRTPDERKMNGVQEVGWALWRRVRKDGTGESLLFPRNIPPRETTLISRFQRETLFLTLA